MRYFKQFSKYFVFIFPVLFISWSILLVLSINQKRKAVYQASSMIHCLNDFEKSIREMSNFLIVGEQMSSIDSLEQQWQNLLNNYQNSLLTLEEKTSNLPELRLQITKIDSLTRSFNLLLVQYAISANRQYAHQGSIFFSDAQVQSLQVRLFNTIYETTETVVSVVESFHHRLSLLTLTLSEKWKQLNILVLISCLMAICVFILLNIWSSYAGKQRQTEAALQASEQKFFTIFNQSVLGIALMDLEGRLIDSNIALQEFLGYSREVLHDSMLNEFIYPSASSTSANYFKVLISGECEYYQGEQRYLRKAGEVVWANLTLFPVKDRQGAAQFIVGMIEDVSDRKLTEEALKKNEERYRLLTEYATDIISRQTTGGVFNDVSPASEKLLGYPPKELIGRNICEFLHPSDIDTLVQARSKVLKKPVISTAIYRARAKDGHYIWLESTIQGIFDPDTGWVKEIISVTRNINRRKKLEKELKQARRRLERCIREYHSRLSLLNKSLKRASLQPPEQSENNHPLWLPYPGNDCLYFSLDSAGHILSVNDTTAKSLGYSVAELLGKNITHFLDDSKREDIRERLKYISENPPEVSQWQLLMRDQTGNAFKTDIFVRKIESLDNPLSIMMIGRIFLNADPSAPLTDSLSGESLLKELLDERFFEEYKTNDG